MLSSDDISVENSDIDMRPMAHIEVRRLDFDFSDLAPSQVLWSRTSPIFSVFANALNLHVPFFEKYLIVAMAQAKEKISSPKLREEVNAIIGQEAQHANAFLGFNQLLKRRYSKGQQLEDQVIAAFEKRYQSDDFRSLVGFTAGYETFTFLAGMIFLNNFDKWFADADPNIKALWIWHQVEEVEHGAVAFDVYKHFFPDDEYFRRKMVLSAFFHIVKETWSAYWHMCRVEGFMKSPWQTLRSGLFLANLISQMMWNCRQVFSKKYHPSQHPFATTQQNPIALAWRKYHRGGGNVLAIDREKMAEILNVSAPYEEQL